MGPPIPIYPDDSSGAAIRRRRDIFVPLSGSGLLILIGLSSDRRDKFVPLTAFSGRFSGLESTYYLYYEARRVGNPGQTGLESTIRY
jgi:hypothetical protein